MKAKRNPSGTWTVRLYVSGRQTQVTAETADLAVAMAEDMRYKARRGELTSPAAYTTTLTTWADEWLNTKNVRRRTHIRYRQAIEVHIKPKLGHLHLAQLRPTHIRQLVADMHTQGLAANTIRNTLTPLKQMLDAAVEDRLLTANPASKVQPPRDEKDKEPQYFTPTQVEKIAGWMRGNNIHADYPLLVEWLAFTGMRWGEATNLRVKWIDPLRGKASIWAAWDGQVEQGTKANEQRSVPLEAALLEQVRGHIASKTPDDFLFEAPNGGRVVHGSFYKFWAKALAATGAPRYSVHALRHSYASWLFSRGTEVARISALLGHSTTATTERVYSHWVSDPGEGIAEALAEIRDTPDEGGEVVEL